MRIIRVVGYARVSTELQADEGASLEAQREKLAAYAKAMDLEAVEHVEDAGFSARTLERPGLRRVLEMLDAGEVEGVMVTRLDRLTRSVRDLGFLIDRYFASKVLLFSLADSVDSRTAGGRLVLHVLGAVSEWERAKTAEATKETLAHLKRQGVRLGGAALGWRRSQAADGDGRRVVEVVQEEQETIGAIVRLREEGATLQSIATSLTSAGRRTKRGGRWSPKTVRAVLLRTRQGA